MSTAVVAGCGSGLTSVSVLTAASCTRPQATPPADASSPSPTDVLAASQPVWSANDGQHAVVVGDTAYGPGAEGRCITATNVATGDIDWSVAPPSDHPELFDVIADASILLAATGVQPPQTGGMEAPVVDQLVAYDPVTGHPRWAVDIAGDSQRMPGVLAGPVIVVSQADGSVVGLSKSDGHKLWQVAAPKGCSANNTWDGTEPNATMLGTTTQGADLNAVVGYACPAGGGVTAIDPANGHIRWAWSVPMGWEVDMQQATTVHTGDPGGDVIAAAISLIPPANAPKNVAPPPGPVTPTQIPNASGDSQTADVPMLDPATGQTLWDLTNVAGGLLTAGGSGALCILTDVGADCRNARNGAPRWSMSWPGRNATSSCNAVPRVHRRSRRRATMRPLQAVCSTSRSQPQQRRSIHLVQIPQPLPAPSRSPRSAWRQGKRRRRSRFHCSTCRVITLSRSESPQPRDVFRRWQRRCNADTLIPEKRAEVSYYEDGVGIAAGVVTRGS